MSIFQNWPRINPHITILLCPLCGLTKSSTGPQLYQMDYSHYCPQVNGISILMTRVYPPVYENFFIEGEGI